MTPHKLLSLALWAFLIVFPVHSSGPPTEEQRIEARKRLMVEEMFFDLYEVFSKTLSGKAYFKFKEEILAYQSQLLSLGAGIYEDEGESLRKLDGLYGNLHIRLKEALGTEAFSRYLVYEESLGVRSRLVQMKNQSGFMIPDEKMRESLVEAMLKVDRSLKVPSNPREQMEFFKGGMNEATKQKVIDLNREATKAYVKASESILPPLLQEEFSRSLESATRVLEFGLGDRGKNQNPKK